MKTLHTELCELASRLYVVFTLSAESTLVNKAADALAAREAEVAELRDRLEVSERLRHESHESEERIAKLYDATMGTPRLHNQSREILERQLGAELAAEKAGWNELRKAWVEFRDAAEECIFDDGIAVVFSLDSFHVFESVIDCGEESE